MKVKNLLMAVAVGLALVGCNNENANRPGEPGEYGEPQYLSVSINTTGGLSGMKAGEEFENGLASENAVEKVRLYFFDADGNATNVKKVDGTEQSYYDYTPDGETTNTGDNNVEKIIDATIIISTQAGDKAPASIVAVINPPALGEINTLDGLNALVNDYSATDKFIMSSSVYADGTKKMEEISVIGHLYPTETAAKANPVTIYVERVLAKARLTVGLTEYKVIDGETLYKAKAKAGGYEQYNGKDVYVKFLGWNVTATTSKSRLMKEINPAWSLGWTWNTDNFHRSFWACNPILALTDYNWGKFDAAQAIKGFNENSSKGANYTYMQENASDSYENGTNPTHPTQIIIAAQLVDENGDALTFAEYGGERMDLDGLKAKFAAASGLWKDKTDGTGKDQIAASDIILKTATEVGEANQQTPGRYKVYAQVDVSKNWYSSNAEDATPVANVNVNLISNLGGAKVWEEGQTYYYFDIQHIGTAAPGNIGVVRNHIYAANITNLTGLGTPVYNPDEIIYPEKPGDDTFIAAEIKILSWRLVKQDISLEW